MILNLCFFCFLWRRKSIWGAKLLINKRLIKLLLTCYEFISSKWRYLRRETFYKSKLINQVIKINKCIWHFSWGCF